MTDTIDSYIFELEPILEYLDLQNKHNGKSQDENNAKHTYTLSDADEHIQLIKLEFMNLSQEQKNSYKLKIKTYEGRLTHIKLMSRTHTNSGDRLEAIHISQNSLDLLKETRSELAKTEEIGSQIIGNLEKQGEQIKHARENVKEIHQNTSFGNKLLVKMSRWWRR